MEKVFKILYKWKKTGIISLLLTVAFFAGNSMGFAKNDNKQVLSAHITPTPTVLPTPTVAPITVINNIIVPTQAPVVITQIVTPTPPQATPTPTVTPTPAISPTGTINPTPTTAPSVTPTPVPQTVEIAITYAGQHTENSYIASITTGESAWEAVQQVVGLANLQYTDYGGSLGIFITGFNGVSAAENQYYDFQVNGVSSNVGVSSYIVADHDVLTFVLTSF